MKLVSEKELQELVAYEVHKVVDKAIEGLQFDIVRVQSLGGSVYTYIRRASRGNCTWNVLGYETVTLPQLLEMFRAALEELGMEFFTTREIPDQIGFRKKRPLPGEEKDSVQTVETTRTKG